MGENHYVVDLALIFILARFFGLFFLSPLLKGFPYFLKCGLCIAFASIFANNYSFTMPSTEGLFLFLNLFKEVCIGLLVGVIFSILFEAAFLGGQIIGTLSGFSAMEYLNPFTLSKSSLMGLAMTGCVATLFFALDLHHTLLIFLQTSFKLIPFESLSFHESLLNVLKGGSFLFVQGLNMLALPFSLLCILLIMIAISQRFFNFSLFWLTFPLQFIIGVIALSCVMNELPYTVKNAFLHLNHLLNRFF